MNELLLDSHDGICHPAQASGRGISGQLQLAPSEIRRVTEAECVYIRCCFSHLGSNHLIWSNYSDLTRPHPKWWFSKGNLLFQGNPGWWNIVIWPDLMIEAKFRNTMWFRCDWMLSLMKCLLAQDLRKNMGKLRVLKDVSANSFSLALCSVREKDQKPLRVAQQSISMAGIDAHMSSHMPWSAQILYILVGTKFLCSLQQHGHVNSSTWETARSPTYQQVTTEAMKCKHLRFVLAGELKTKPTSMPF